MILEYCDQRSLGDLMVSYARSRQSFSSEYLWHILLSITKGLAYMHEGIADVTRDTRPFSRSWIPTFHLDLKPDNIFLASSGQRGSHPRVVIGDFGGVVTARDIDVRKASPRPQDLGNPYWNTPEHQEGVVGLYGVRYGPESDIWQTGAITVSYTHLTLPTKRIV